MDIQNIEKSLKKLATPERKKAGEWYIKTSMQTLGNAMPDVRKALKDLLKQNDDLDHKELAKKFDEIWRDSNIFETLFLPIFYFSGRKYKLDLSDWKTLRKWTKKIDNWAHSDMYSGAIAYIVENHPKEMLEELKKWNKSKNPWERRLSLTSLIYYASTRKSFLSVKEILKLVENLLHDDHVYVQKAVGWTLREAGNIYPKETSVFIKKHLLDLSPIAFTSATEKWTKVDKEPLKMKRKNNRKRKS